MLQWFWLIKLFFLIIGLTLAWKYYKTKKNIYAVLLIIWLILAIVNPVKINNTNAKEMNVYNNIKIEKSKVLPEKIEDNSYNERTKLQGITDKDIDLTERK